MENTEIPRNFCFKIFIIIIEILKIFKKTMAIAEKMQILIEFFDGYAII